MSVKDNGDKIFELIEFYSQKSAYYDKLATEDEMNARDNKRAGILCSQYRQVLMLYVGSFANELLN